MSLSFDIKRFGKLVRHDVHRCSPRFSIVGQMLISSLLFVPMMVVTQSFVGSTYGSGYRLLLVVTESVAMASQIPLLLYTYVSQKKKRGDIYFAMLPASKLEKYLSIVLLSMVLVPLALTVANIAIDSLLTAVHVPLYHKYLWQSDALDMISLPKLCCSALAFIGPTFGFIYVNAVRNKAWRIIMCLLLLLWMISGMFVALIIEVAEIDIPLWIIIVAEAALAALMAFLGWNKMNRIGY